MVWFITAFATFRCCSPCVCPYSCAHRVPTLLVLVRTTICDVPGRRAQPTKMPKVEGGPLHQLIALTTLTFPLRPMIVLKSCWVLMIPLPVLNTPTLPLRCSVTWQLTSPAPVFVFSKDVAEPRT